MSRIFVLSCFQKWMTTMQALTILACSYLICFTQCHEEWYLVFKAVTGGTISAYDLYTGCDTSLVTKGDAFNDIEKNHFKSDVINYWEKMDIKEVKVEIHKNGVAKAFFIFNGTGTNKANWFSKERLLNTSYTDLHHFSVTHFFGIDGDANIARHFMIHARYSGCPGDVGWIMVTEKNQVCPYEKVIPGKSVVIFSPENTATTFKLPGTDFVADSMNIYVKFDSNKSFCTPERTVPTTSGEKLSEYTTTILDTTTNSVHTSTHSVDTSTTNQDFSTTDVETTTNKNDVSSTTERKQVLSIKDEVEKLKKILTVDKKSTNKYKRSLISPYEKRTSAAAMGTIGVAIICIVIGLIVAVDVITCVKSLHTKITRIINH